MSDQSEQFSALSPKKQELFHLLMEKKRKANTASSLQTIMPVPRTGPLPLSFAQQRLWFLDQWQPGTPIFNLMGCTRLVGALDVTALEAALNEIWRRHEALRTCFPTTDGQPSQHVMPAGSLSLNRLYVDETSQVDSEIQVQQTLDQESQRTFDLANGPLFVPTLISVNSEHHVLTVTMHHIVSDGWSASLFGRELAVLYSAFVAGKDSPLPPLPIQYGDYAQWQRSWLQGEILDSQIAYWRKQLSGVPEILNLPLDHPRSDMQTFNGSRESISFSENLTSQLRALSRQHGTTLFMTLLAAFQVLLSRYSGEKDIVVGSPVAGRNRPEMEGLMGLFVNTLAFRTDLSGDSTFAELLSKVRETTLDAYAHQDLPFEKLVEELHPSRDLSRPPLFQVMFVLQNSDSKPVELPELKILPIAAPAQTAQFDLTLYLWDEATKLAGQLEFNTDLLEPVSVRRMIGHFLSLLENIVADPNQPLSSIAMMNEDEIADVCRKAIPSATVYPSELTVCQLFENQVERTPDAVAVVFNDKELTYLELNERANALAQRLRSLGAGPESLVGLCVDRSELMVVGLLGVLKAGAAFVPLDPAYPQDRLLWMLEDTALSVLITERELLDSLPPVDQVEIVFLDEELSRQAENIETLAVPTNLAYVIYTSGSTGRPKGVMIEHRALTNFICSMQTITGAGTDDTLLAVTTLGFDIAGLEMFLPLTVGAKLAIASRDTVIDGQALLAEIDRLGVTLMQATPVTWRLMLDNGWTGSPNMVALCGGEALSRELANKLVARTKELWNMYGPTETTIWSTASKVEHRDGPVFIGGPIANTQILILDDRAKLVPWGVPGEIHIGGDGLARGYLNRDDLTNERFIFRAATDKLDTVRLYKTGDLARYRADGSIEFLGRLDQQVKVRGHRIEPGEIEAALREFPGVAEVVVVARGEGSDKRLVAYLVSELEISADDLRRFLMQSLPEYMVPTSFVRLTQLPLTPNGKIDRRSLPAPNGNRPKPNLESQAPQSEMEQSIAAIWQEVLHVEKVGRDETFFDLGGHSLLMAQVRNSLNTKLHIDLSIVELFKFPTVGSLAEHIAQRGEGRESANVQHRAGARLESLRTQRRQRQLR